MIYTYYKQHGNKILLRYKKGKETITTEFTNYRPCLFTPDTSDEAPNTHLTSIYGKPLRKMQFGDIKAAKEFVKQYSGVDNFRIEGNSRFDNQFIIELLEGKSPQYQTRDLIGYIIDIEVAVPDDAGFCEPAAALWPISAITNYNTLEKKFYVFGNSPHLNTKWSQSLSPEKIKKLNIEYIHCESEEELIVAYLEYFGSAHPDFTSGWNSESFDMPYIVTRFKSVVGPGKTRVLSPFGLIFEKTKSNEFGNQVLKVEICGIPHLDYLELYKKHIFTPRESYKLGFIAQEELGEDKLDYNGSLYQLYTGDYKVSESDDIDKLNEPQRWARLRSIMKKSR